MNFEFPAVLDAAIGNERVLGTARQVLAGVLCRRNERQRARPVVRC